MCYRAECLAMSGGSAPATRGPQVAEYGYLFRRLDNRSSRYGNRVPEISTRRSRARGHDPAARSMGYLFRRFDNRSSRYGNRLGNDSYRVPEISTRRFGPRGQGARRRAEPTVPDVLPNRGDRQ